MMRPLRLGIIGTGVAARELHWPALKLMPDCYQVVAVANRTLGKAQAFAEMVGLDPSAVYNDYRELLARGDLDVVDLALPPELNYQVAREVAAAGLHVICEKPIAVTVEDAHAMAALPEMYGVQVLIAENFRYDPAVQRARRIIEEGKVTAPFMMSYQYTQPVPPDDEIANRPWRQQPSHAGGCLSDHGVHMVDVARYLMGEVAQVQVFARDLRDYLVGIDTATYNLTFASGALGSIQWSFSVASDPTSHIQLWCDEGTIHITPGQVRLARQGQPDEDLPCIGSNSFVNEFKDFYQALSQGKPLVMTIQDALQDLKVILAAFESIRTHRVVVLDRETDQ